MFNLHLLQIDLSIEAYAALGDPLRHSQTYYPDLPAYMIARCPLCQAENIEKVDTCSLKHWLGINFEGGQAVWGRDAIVHHCEHFALVQPFFNFHGLVPSETEKEFGPEVPHVIGYMLEKWHCLAVIHALPVCRIEEQAFVPRYTLFMVSYFTHGRPADVRKQVLWTSNIDFYEAPINMFSQPLDGSDHWWDLRQWVAAGSLYWVDGNDPALGLRTGDAEVFPYGEITGRRYPYFGYASTQARILRGQAADEFGGKKPRIKAFKWIRHADDEGGKSETQLIEWNNTTRPGFSFSKGHSLSHYYLPPDNLIGPGKQVEILVQDMQRFDLRRDPATGLTEVMLKIVYAPGERTLGLTDNEAEARRWVQDANKWLASTRHPDTYLESLVQSAASWRGSSN